MVLLQLGAVLVVRGLCVCVCVCERERERERVRGRERGRESERERERERERVSRAAYYTSNSKTRATITKNNLESCNLDISLALSLTGQVM